MTNDTAAEARLKHDQRVAAARRRLDTINAKAKRNHTLGLHRALQRAAVRFLPPGAVLPEPRVLDLVRWPYTNTGRLIHIVPTELRDAVLAEDVTCAWCRKKPSTTIDHVRPVSRGGTSNPLNLVGACNPCNSAKSDFLPSELGWVLRLPLRAFALRDGIWQ
jgi:hypothetical protein